MGFARKILGLVGIRVARVAELLAQFPCLLASKLDVLSRIIVVAALISSPCIARAAAYTILDLDAPDGTDSFANCINSSGQITGSAIFPGAVSNHVSERFPAE